jgi:hypothetical protein
VPNQAVLHAPPSLLWPRGTARRRRRLGDLPASAGVGGETHPRDMILNPRRPRRDRLHASCAEPSLGETWWRGDSARPVVAAGPGVEAGAWGLDAVAGVTGGGGGWGSLSLSLARHPAPTQ